jgi:hypothetical protein
MVRTNGTPETTLTWHQQAKAAREKAEKLRPGKERDELLRMARQLETASQMHDWLASPGLRPPV